MSPQQRLIDRRSPGTLFYAGNRNAVPGSHDWAIAVRLDIVGGLHEKDSNAEHLERLVTLFRRHEGWRVLGFASYEAFCRARELDGGLGKPAEEIDDHIQNLRKGPGAPPKAERNSRNARITPGYSDTRMRVLARLERDAPGNPEVAVELERVRSGESKPHAAAVRLGWRSPKHCKSCRCFE